MSTDSAVSGSAVSGSPVPGSPVDDALYDLLRVDRLEWAGVGRPLDPAETQTLGALIAKEAWLLDQGRFEDWLELYSDSCLYWVPASAAGDPQREVTLAFDDRRRLGDRIGWLRTGLASAQIPRSRTTHLISGSVVLPTASEREVKVRSSFVVHECRTGPTRAIAGWCGHVFSPGPGPDPRWLIARKVVQLVDAHAGWRNLTFLL